LSAEGGSLEFAARESPEFLDRALALARSARQGVHVHPQRTGLAEALARQVQGLRLTAEPADADTIILESDAADLPADLLRLADLPRLRVLAPLGAGHFSRRPLFLVSIPKSGTHLVNKMVEVMGYELGILHDEFVHPGKWYCVEYTNTHTVARDFFVDSVRRAPYGNRYHAFTTSPAIFVYRNPLDVLVSEANYYHLEGRTSFGGYLSHLSFEERVHRLIDDRWLLGSIRERIGGFAPWLDFQNVIPVAFEEVIGEKGGGSREAQLGLIWSLQLKLQVPGLPQAIADRIFGDSPTFFQGRIGAWRNALTPGHLARLRALDQDFMRVLGYDMDAPDGALPRRAMEFRRRPLALAQAVHDKTPITLEYHYLGFNLVRYGGAVYAVPQATGPGFDLRQTPPERLQLLPHGQNLAAVRHRIAIESLVWGGNPLALAEDLCRQLSGAAPGRRGVRGLLRLASRWLR
jgi:hypothetical protein